MSAARRKQRLPWQPISAALACAVLLSGCKVGPKYVTPTAPVPPAYKEPQADSFKEAHNSDPNWKQAQPIDSIPKGAWWTIFRDDTLNQLEPKVELANQTLRVADANLRAARAEIRVRNADRFPSLGLNPAPATGRYTSGSPYFNPGPNFAVPSSAQYPLDFAYQVDIWGTVRRNIAAGKEESQASAADRVNILLSLQSELALDYFELRIADSQKQLLQQTVAQYQDAVRITTNRFQGGVAIKADVTQAQTQLQQAKVALADVDEARAQYEHAIANLIGEAPASLTIAYSPLPIDTVPPEVPAGLPSQLLERRPDIAAAERRAQEGNEAIGIATAAYYPSVLLTAALGYASTNTLSSVFTPASAVYSVGPGIAYTIFDGGRRKGIKEEAYAQFDRNSAAYKQTVITAFQQVEDQLVALHVLSDESVQQHAATVAAVESQRIYNNRYVGGVDNFLQVINAQNAALLNERNEIDILRRRMDASVQLVIALGGGWDRTQLPPQ